MVEEFPFGLKGYFTDLHFSMRKESSAFLCKITNFGSPMMQLYQFCIIGEPNFRKKEIFLLREK